MNVQSLPFRTGAGKTQDDGKLLLATWRCAVATEIRRDCHKLTELRCHQEFGDLGYSALRGRVQQSGLLQLTQEAAATVGTICLPRTLVPPPLLSCPFSCRSSGPHSALGILSLILSQPSVWKTLVAPHTLREAGDQ